MAKKEWTEQELAQLKVMSKIMTEAEEQKVKDLIITSRIQTMIKLPFFGYLIMHLELQPRYDILTAATDGNHLYYNPHFIKALPAAERTWIIVHEIMHPALQHLWRRSTRDPELWNIACDYAVHSAMQQYIDSISDMSCRNAMKMPKNALYNKKYDDMYTEQIYDSLLRNSGNSCKNCSGKGSSNGNSKNNSGGKGGKQTLDDHSMWDDNKNDSIQQEISRQKWESRITMAAQMSQSKGNLPGFLQRYIDKLTKPQKNWRQILAEFIEYVNDDYTFVPPDYRIDIDAFDGIMLPAFADQTAIVKNIIFYIDTSGSISTKQLTYVFSEMIGAMEQFKGKLSGKVGFFDATAYPLTDFEDVDDIMKLKPVGGGGTEFEAPLRYVKDKVPADEVAGIIIMTDGYCDWPDEKLANDKPVLWLINNEERTPPWGQIARIRVDE